MSKFLFRSCLINLACTLSFVATASAQAPVPTGSPLPSNEANKSPTASVPTGFAPIPGPNFLQMAKSGQTNGQSIYSRLPLTYYDSVYRLEELKNSIAMLKPKEAEESISQFCDWILELQEAHQKLAKTFSKTESMKPNSEQEAKTAKKFAELRHQAFLVKAEFLINQKRYPEALGPLTDVVNAEPGTELGQTAYKYLQKIGFSEPVEVYVGAAQAPSKTIANGSKLSDK